MSPVAGRRPGPPVSIAKMQYYGGVSWIVEVLDARVRDEIEALPPDMRARFAELWN